MLGVGGRREIEMNSRVDSLILNMRRAERASLNWCAHRYATVRLALGKASVPSVDRRISLRHYLLHARPLVMLTAPLIYCVFLPFLLLDLVVTLYQMVCFPVYGIARVRRSEYLTFDRARLPYLNALEKFNCAYCSYANGVVGYVAEIAARTEQYWCAIKHVEPPPAPHRRYGKFADYGNAGAYHDMREILRDQLGERGKDS